MLRYSLALALLTASVSPSLADYFVVQNTSTKECSIIRHTEKPAPDDTTMVIIGTKNYQTVEEAETTMKAAEECKAKQ